MGSQPAGEQPPARAKHTSTAGNGVSTHGTRCGTAWQRCCCCCAVQGERTVRYPCCCYMTRTPAQAAAACDGTTSDLGHPQLEMPLWISAGRLLTTATQDIPLLLLVPHRALATTCCLVAHNTTCAGPSHLQVSTSHCFMEPVAGLSYVRIQRCLHARNFGKSWELLSPTGCPRCC